MKGKELHCTILAPNRERPREPCPYDLFTKLRILKLNHLQSAERVSDNLNFPFSFKGLRIVSNRATLDITARNHVIPLYLKLKRVLGDFPDDD